MELGEWVGDGVGGVWWFGMEKGGESGGVGMLWGRREVGEMLKIWGKEG